MTKNELIWNSKWSGPKGELNPMGLKVPGLISVQVFPSNLTKSRWILRNPDTGGLLSKIEFGSRDQAMGFCGHIFEKQESPWVQWRDSKEYRMVDGKEECVTDAAQ